MTRAPPLAARTPAAPVDLYAAALALADTGIPVFPCGPAKQPLTPNGYKDANLCPAPRDYIGAALIGVPTGSLSLFDVVDIDPRHGGDVWLEQNRHRLPITRTQRTQSGGTHLYFRARPGLRCSTSKIATGVDVRAESGYVIAWQAAGLETLHANEVADWPEWLADLARGHRVRHADNPSRSTADLAPPSAQAVVALLKRMPNPDDATRDDYLRVLFAAKGCIDGLAGEGEDEIAEAAIQWACRWHASPGYEAEEAKWRDDFATRDAPLAGWTNLLAAAQRFGMDTVAERADAAAGEFSAVAVVEPTPPAELLGNPHWHSKLLLNDKGNVKPVLANLLLALRESPAWAGVLGYDEFRARAAFVAPPPWHRGAFVPHQVKDADIVRTADWAQTHDISVSSAVAADAIHAAADEAPFHTVRSYLRGLKWDGVPRAERWLVDYLGAEDTELNRAFGLKFLLGAVARAMKPGCQVDTMLVLEGPQGMRKSTALRVMAGDENFADHIPDLSSKDAMQQLQGVWILEQAEMATLRRADMNRVKEFISRRVDRFRPSFGRVADDYPRQCVFAGTLNPGGLGYLTDETGARRFWPVRCAMNWPEGRQVDAAALVAARDDLWAEAVHRFAAGQPWWLDDRQQEIEQQAAAAERYDADVWTERVAEIIAGKAFVRSDDVLERLGFKHVDMNKAAQMRVAGVVTALGWKPAKRYVDGKQVRGFAPPPGASVCETAKEPEITDLM